MNQIAMPDLFGGAQFRKASRLRARVCGVFVGTGFDPAFPFVTAPAQVLDLTLDGIVGDVHAGATRRSGGREPWYPRGTVIRNERQVSIVSAEELAAIAGALGLPELSPTIIGGNLLLEGITAMTLLPPRTRMTFSSGAVLRIDGENTPCRRAGRALAAAHPDRPGLDVAFVKAARRQRGLMAWVERPGRIVPGDEIDIAIPEHWLYLVRD